MAKPDVGFTFDPKPFLNALGMIGKGLDNTKKTAEKTAQSIGKSFTWAVAKGQLLASGITAVAKSIKNVVSQQIPEIGQSFGIAKEIIFKNLFWPIRQQIVPILQTMLNWVRDNRTLFVKMGETIVAIFRTGWTVAKSFIQVLSPVWNAITRLLGFTKGNWMDHINVILTKVAFVAIYLGNLLKPVGQLLGDIIDNVSKSGIIELFAKLALSVADVAKFLINMAAAFGKGFFSNIKTIMEPIKAIFGAVEKLFKAIGGQANSNFLGNLFGGLGKALGAGLTTGLNTVAVALNTIVDTIMFLAGMAPVIGDIFSGKWGDVGGHFKDALGNFKGLGDQLKESFGSSAKSWGNVFTPEQKVKDGVVQNGRAVGTDPKDVIIAHKGLVSVNKSTSTQMMGNWTVHLTVTEGGARAAGKNFADGMQYEIRSILAQEAMVGGR